MSLSCSSTSEPATGDVLVDLRSADPQIRIQAVQAAVQGGETSALADLIRNLSDPDPAVRMFTAIGLEKLTGQTFDYKPYGTLAEREEAIARWNRWLAENRDKFQLSARAPATEES